MTVRAVHGRTHGRTRFRGWLASRGAPRRVGRWQLCARWGQHHAPGGPRVGLGLTLGCRMYTGSVCEGVFSRAVFNDQRKGVATCELG